MTKKKKKKCYLNQLERRLKSFFVLMSANKTSVKFVVIKIHSGVTVMMVYIVREVT